MKISKSLGKKINTGVQKAYFLFIAFFFLVPGAYYGSLYFEHDFNPNFLKIENCLDRDACWDFKLKKCVDLDSEPTLQCQRAER